MTSSMRINSNSSTLYSRAMCCPRQHSVVGLVDRLVSRRLLRRLPSAVDRRRVEVRLTAGGEAVIGRLAAAHLRELRQLGPELHRLIGSIIAG